MKVDRCPTREEVARRTIDRLRRFTEQLEAGEKIPCKNVTVEHTPDGTLTTTEAAQI